jgi:hypothetical protein
MMLPKRLAAAIILAAYFLALSGCYTLRFNVATEYGTFTYEPKPTSTK